MALWTGHLDYHSQLGDWVWLSIAVVVVCAEETVLVKTDVVDDRTVGGDSVVGVTTVELLLGVTVELFKLELLDTGTAVVLALLDVLFELTVEFDEFGSGLATTVSCECVSWFRIDKNMTKTRNENVWLLIQFDLHLLTYRRRMFDSTTTSYWKNRKKLVVTFALWSVRKTWRTLLFVCTPASLFSLSQNTAVLFYSPSERSIKKNQFFFFVSQTANSKGLCCITNWRTK